MPLGLSLARSQEWFPGQIQCHKGWQPILWMALSLPDLSVPHALVIWVLHSRCFFLGFPTSKDKRAQCWQAEFLLLHPVSCGWWLEFPLTLTKWRRYFSQWDFQQGSAASYYSKHAICPPGVMAVALTLHWFRSLPSPYLARGRGWATAPPP